MNFKYAELKICFANENHNSECVVNLILLKFAFPAGEIRCPELIKHTGRRSSPRLPDQVNHSKFEPYRSGQASICRHVAANLKLAEKYFQSAQRLAL